MKWVLWVSLFVGAVLCGELPRAEEAREIGTAKQLFVDEDMIAGMEGVQLTLNPARRAERVLTATKPWESAGIGFCTVIKDGELFRMWYGAWFYDETIEGHWMQRICYATSRDGIRWQKPSLGQSEFQGSRDNNIIALGYRGYATGFTVFVDPNAASPAEKYKMIFGDFYRVQPYPGSPRSSVSGAVSPDGIHWKSVDTPHGVIMSWSTDTQNVAFYDPHTRRYVAYVRLNTRRAGSGNDPKAPASRRVARSESADFQNFPKPVEILAPDEKDPGGPWGSGLYTSAATVYPFAPNVYLFFPTLMEYDTALCTIQFASSRNGINIERRFRKPYVPLNPNAKVLGGQTAYAAYMGPGMIRLRDEIWMYGVEQDVPHDSAWYGKRVSGGIQRYVQRLDGFVSVDAGRDLRSSGAAGDKPGRLLTRSFVLRGESWEVNADAASLPALPSDEDLTAPPSALTVKLLNLEGKELASSEPISVDGVAVRLSWKGGGDLGDFVGKSVRLLFEMRFAKLYAFQVVRGG